MGNLVLEGGDIYSTGLNTWPPFFSLICVPLALIAAPTPYLARAIWILGNYAFFVLLVRLIAGLVYEREFSLTRADAGLSLASVELLVPILLTYLFIASNFEHLQINILIFLLTLAGLRLQRGGRELSGGIAIGCAAAMKLMPLAFVPYLVYRGRLRAAVSAAVTAAALSLSPILVFGASRFWGYVVAWTHQIERGWGVGKMNQSIFAMLDRYAGHEMLPVVTEGANGVPASGDALVAILWLGSILALLASGLLIFRRNAAQDSHGALAEWSIVFIAAALFGTVCWKAYLVVLLLPNALLFKEWRSPRVDAGSRRVLGVILFTAGVMAGINSRSILGEDLSGRLEMASWFTISTLLMLCGLFWYRSRLARGPAACA